MSYTDKPQDRLRLATDVLMERNGLTRPEASTALLNWCITLGLAAPDVVDLIITEARVCDER